MTGGRSAALIAVALLLTMSCTPATPTRGGDASARPRSSASETPVTSPTSATSPSADPAGRTAAPQAFGTIAGRLSYPSEMIPPMRIYAIDTAAPARYRVVHMPANATRYTIAGVAPGSYYVLATPYTMDRSGVLRVAYTRSVACGMTAACTDHSLLAVQVRPGTTTDGADLLDWPVAGALLDTPTGREPFAPGDLVVVDNPYADGVNGRDQALLGAAVARSIPNGTVLRVEAFSFGVDGYDWYSVSPEPDVKLVWVVGYALRRR